MTGNTPNATDLEDALQIAKAEMVRHGLEVQHLVPDGEIHRFGKKHAGWYRLHDDGAALYGHYGDWRDYEQDDGWRYIEVAYNGADPEAAGQRREQADKAFHEADLRPTINIVD